MEKYRVVRRARMEDAQTLGRIMALSFRSAFSGFISRQTLEACAVEENCAGLFTAILEEGRMGVLLGSIDEEPMGLLVFSRRQDGWTEIEAIHSLPQSWGSGLGESLLDHALAETNARTGAGLWAFAENKRARRFYEKHGFHFTGESRISDFDGAVEVRYERKWAQ